MAKSISEQYRELLEKKKQIDEKRENKQAPDPAKDPRGYIDGEAEYREIKGHISFLNKVVMDEEYSEEERLSILQALMGKDKVDKKVETIWKDQSFSNHVQQKLFVVFPELKAFVSEEDQKKLAYSYSESERIVTDLIGKGKLKEDDLKKLIYPYLFNISFVKKDDKIKKFLDVLDEKLDDAKKERIIGKMNAYRSVKDLSFEEQVTHPYSKRIADLKKDIPQNIANDPQKLQEYNEALDYADSHLTLVDDKVKNEREAYESNVQKVGSRHSKHLYEQSKDTYENGKFNNLYKTVELGSRKVTYVDEEKTEDFNSLYNGTYVMSDKLKDGFRRMLQKMDEMKLSEYATDVSGEDGYKIYGLCKLYREKYALIDTLNEEHPDPNKIIAAKKAYEKTWNDMKELHEIAKECFSQDDTYFPGNVDGTRNEHLPWEFTHDVMTTAQVNTVFLIHMNLKNNKKTIDEYLENPVKNFYTEIENKVRPYTFEGMVEGKSFSDQLDILLGRGEYASACDRLRTANAIPVMGIGRMIEGPYFLEGDKVHKEQGIVFSKEYQNIMNVFTGLHNAKFTYLAALNKTEAQKERKLTTLKNLLTAADKDRNVNNMLAGLPEVDIFGRVKGPAFDWNDYVETKKADYTGIVKRYSVMLTKCSEEFLSNALNKDDCILAMNDVAKKVLLQNAVDRNREGFRALEQRFLNLYSELSNKAPADLRAKLESDRADYIHTMRIRSKGTFLSNLNAYVQKATENVHGGSDEFDQAMKALESLSKEYSLLSSFGKKTPYDTSVEQLKKVRSEMESTIKKINKYLDRKNTQKNKGKRLNDKSKKRINVMKLSLDHLHELRYAIDDKEMELDRFRVDKQTAELLEIENRLPEKTREELINEIRNAHIEDPDFDTFIERLDTLNEEMGGLMSMTADGWKELDAETLAPLKEKYINTGGALEWFIAKNKNATDPGIISLRESCKKLSAILSKDMDEIRVYDPAKGLKTLPTLLENSRTETLDISNETLNIAHGAQSQRIPMSMVDESGNVVSGFFTKAAYNDPVKVVGDILEKSSAKATTPEGKRMIKNLLLNYMQTRDNGGMGFTDRAKYAGAMLNEIAEPDTNWKVISEERVINLLKLVYQKNEKEITALCGKKVIQDMKKALIKPMVPVIVNDSLDIPENARLDSRNVGMSLVADLLGMSDIICRSRSMKLKAKDGTIVEGTFMENAKGVAGSYPGNIGFRPNNNTLSGGSGMGLKSLADLQVLDYICGNVDRHSGNMFYQFEDRKLVGVQGIDNDSSFPANSYYETNEFMKMVAPKNMLVMSKETADKILELKPGQIIFALRGKIEEAAIDKAVQRFKNMKDAIRQSREYFLNHPKGIQTDHITEVSDNEWKNINLAELTGGEKKNIFTEAAAAMHVIAYNSNVKSKIEMKEIGNLNRATEGGIFNEIKNTRNMIKNLEDAGIKTGELTTSANAYKTLLENTYRRIKDMRQKVKNGDKSPEAIYGQFINQADLEMIREGANSLKEAAETFKAQKEATLNGRPAKGKNKLKIDAANKVKEFAANRKEITANEQERAGINSRQATEQMIKAKKAVIPQPVAHVVHPEANRVSHPAL